MVDAIGNLAASTAATFLPLYLGLATPILASAGSQRRVRVMMAISSGIMFWFFLDVMNDAVLLDVNQGLSGGLGQALLVAFFAFGLLFLFGAERAFAKTKVENAGGGLNGVTYAIAVLVALGIGFHAFGEGIVIGSLIPVSANMIVAIGGFAAGVSYALHKFLEGFVIGVFAVNAKPIRVLILGLVACLPTILGSLLALLTPVNSTFFFALGGAAAVYVELKLVPRAFAREGALMYVLASLIGFYAMYFAGLLHA